MNVAERIRRAGTRATRSIRIGMAGWTRPDLHIVGSYYTRNVGDVALGLAMAGACDRVGANAWRLPFDGTTRDLPPAPGVVLGGGGLLTPHGIEGTRALAAWCERYGASFSACGMSGDASTGELGPEVEALYRGARWLGVRDEGSRRALSRLTGREDVVLHPDLAFSLGSVVRLPGTPRRARIGINVLPVVMHEENGRWVPNRTPSAWYRDRFPVLAARYGEVGPSALAMVRRVAEAWIARGREVVHIPFAEEDDGIARQAFAGLAVRALPPTTSVSRTLARVASCEGFVGMRFHAGVFGLLARTPTWSVAYAPKGEELWRSLALPEAACVTAESWLVDGDRSVERLLSTAGGVLSGDRLAVLRTGAAAAADTAVRSVLSASRVSVGRG